MFRKKDAPKQEDHMEYFNHTLEIKRVGGRLEQFKNGDGIVEQTDQSVVDYVGTEDHRQEVEKRANRSEKPLSLQHADGSTTYLIASAGIVFHEDEEPVFSLGHEMCVAADFTCRLDDDGKEFRATFHLFAGSEHEMRVNMLTAIQAMRKNGVTVNSGRLFGRSNQRLGIEIDDIAEGIMKKSGIYIEAVELDLPKGNSQYDLLITAESHQEFPHVISERLLINDRVSEVLTGAVEDFS